MSNYQDFYADLHIHIGRSRGHAVKVTASRDLTLEQVLFRDAPAVGLNIAGIVDAACSGVALEIEGLLAEGADAQTQMESLVQARGGL